MKTYVVTFISNESDELEVFACQADDEDHAAEQCQNAYSNITIYSIEEETA